MRPDHSVFEALEKSGIDCGAGCGARLSRAHHATGQRNDGKEREQNEQDTTGAGCGQHRENSCVSEVPSDSR